MECKIYVSVEVIKNQKTVSKNSATYVIIM